MIEEPSGQTPEELAAHYGKDGAVAAAGSWLATYLDLGLGAVWVRTDPSLRLVMAQGWLWANRSHPEIVGQDLDELAARIVEAAPADGWPRVVLSYLDAELRGQMAPWLLDGRYGAASRPRPIATGYELVVLLECGDEPRVFTELTQEYAELFVMRQTPHGWLLAGFGDERVPTPGWPPR